MQSISQQARANGTGYPKFMYPDPAYHGIDAQPVIVDNVEDQKKLGPGYYDQYRHQEYPRTMYKVGAAKIQPAVIKPDGTVTKEEKVIHVTRLVTSIEEEQALGAAWTRVPPDPYFTGESELVRSAEEIEAEKEKLAAENAGLKAAHAAELDELKRQLAAAQAKQHQGGPRQDPRGAEQKP